METESQNDPEQLAAPVVVSRAEVSQRTKEYIQERTDALAAAQIALMTATNSIAKTAQEKIIDKLNKELERAKTGSCKFGATKRHG